MKPFNLIFATVSLVAGTTKCPTLTCNMGDKKLLDKNLCYKHSATDPSTYIKIEKCEDDIHGNKFRCMMEKGDYAWVTSDLQFKPDRTEIKESQLFGLYTEKKCTPIEASVQKLNNGRKCTYHFQCISRVCNDETKACKGREKGESCNDHVQCDRNLACRSSIIWPYETQCLPMGDVNSRCETDYDCKPRNFCWKKYVDEKDKGRGFTPKICLEKHVSPDSTAFWWDETKFPDKDKEEAIYTHGNYCKSGTAYKKDDQAICISINKIQVKNKEGVQDPTEPNPVTRDYGDSEATGGKEPMPCVPGEQVCVYMKDEKEFFTQNCECSLQAKNLPQGYCPIPSLMYLRENNDWLKKLWLGDTCHTYDRDNIKSQLECGIGMNNNVLMTVTNTNFMVKYFPFVQSTGNKKCLEEFVHDSNFNMFEEMAQYIKISTSALVILSCLNM